VQGSREAVGHKEERGVGECGFLQGGLEHASYPWEGLVDFGRLGGKGCEEVGNEGWRVQGAGPHWAAKLW